MKKCVLLSLVALMVLIVGGPNALFAAINAGDGPPPVQLGEPYAIGQAPARAAAQTGAAYLPLLRRPGTANQAPAPPSAPSPADGARDVPLTATLSWWASDPDGDALTYVVTLDVVTPPATQICAGVANRSCQPDALAANTTYYWQVVATDAGAGQTAGPVWSFTTAESAPETDFATEVVALVNQERAAAGCSPLAVDPLIENAALAHSRDMARNDFFSHTGSDGSSPADRVTAQGYEWTRLGENIAAGYTSPAAVVAGWMDSPGHRANILNCDFTETGVGYYYLENDSGETNYHHYWTHDFARPRS